MQQNKKIKGAKNVLMFLLYAGPAVIVFTAVILIAFINGIQLTFTDWNGLTDEYQYIGFSNYADAFRMHCSGNLCSEHLSTLSA